MNDELWGYFLGKLKNVFAQMGPGELTGDTSKKSFELLQKINADFLPVLEEGSLILFL